MISSVGGHKIALKFLDTYQIGNVFAQDFYGVRPLLITNIKSENLKLYDICKIFDINWYYIGEGKFLCQDIVDYSMFDLESNNYEKTYIKKYVDYWLEMIIDDWEIRRNENERK